MICLDRVSFDINLTGYWDYFNTEICGSDIRDFLLFFLLFNFFLLLWLFYFSEISTEQCFDLPDYHKIFISFLLISIFYLFSKFTIDFFFFNFQKLSVHRIFSFYHVLFFLIFLIAMYSLPFDYISQIFLSGLHFPLFNHQFSLLLEDFSNIWQSLVNHSLLLFSRSIRSYSL